MYHQISQYKIRLCVCPQLGRLPHPLQSRNLLKTLKLLSSVCLSCAQISETQVKRIGRKGKRLWKRVRTSLRAKRDPVAFAQAKEELQALHLRHTKGEIDLYFFDAAGFSLTPCVPYAWQPVGEYIEVPVAKSRRLNVLGFLSSRQPLTSFVFEETIDSQVITAGFNEFCKTLTKPTWVVIDNAPLHTSDAFRTERGMGSKRALHQVSTALCS